MAMPGSNIDIVYIDTPSGRNCLAGRRVRAQRDATVAATAVAVAAVAAAAARLVKPRSVRLVSEDPIQNRRLRSQRDRVCVRAPLRVARRDNRKRAVYRAPPRRAEGARAHLRRRQRKLGAQLPVGARHLVVVHKVCGDAAEDDTARGGMEGRARRCRMPRPLGCRDAGRARRARAAHQMTERATSVRLA
eukprot:2515859-Prymnesium_polylepis.1